MLKKKKEALLWILVERGKDYIYIFFELSQGSSVQTTGHMKHEKYVYTVKQSIRGIHLSTIN